MYNWILNEYMQFGFMKDRLFVCAPRFKIVDENEKQNYSVM